MPPAPASAQSTATTTDYLNLRTGAGLDHAIITVMPIGAAVSLTGAAEAGFYPVAYGGHSGYASGDYLDLGGGGANSGGAAVLWRHDSSSGLAIDMGNGYIVAMFHVTFDGALGSGGGVEQGQYLGTISGPGGAGYATTPHVDMTLWQSGDGGRSRAAAPFTGGNAISGWYFPDVSGCNQHNGTTFNS